MKVKRQLTKSEMQVMRVLWSMPKGEAYAADIMERYDEPRPAMTTLLTFLKILREKGFVGAEKHGRSHLFRALVSREEYTGAVMDDVKDTFFGGSAASLVSFFARRESLSEEEINELRRIIDNVNPRNSP
ncbi:MAG: BlaI/MecI/CopY family transcriptional regulator [Prevotella sp.]|nr:BlaI/MecI/CopY family transcriptional regulator [Prevotella sp.]